MVWRGFFVLGEGWVRGDNAEIIKAKMPPKC